MRRCAGDIWLPSPADTGVGTSEKSKWLAQLAESSRVQPATSRCCTQLLVGQLARGNSDFTLLTQSRHTSGLTAGEARGLIFVHRALSKIISKFRETHFTKFKNRKPAPSGRFNFCAPTLDGENGWFSFCAPALKFPLRMSVRSAATSLCATKATEHACFFPLTRRGRLLSYITEAHIPNATVN